jgi:hypothetical protein
MSEQTYQQQLRHLVRAMSMPNRETETSDSLNFGSGISRVKMFVDGNLEKRREKLERQLEFLGDGFDDLGELIVEFIKAEPLGAFGSAVSDGERMLQWLSAKKDPTALQRDYIACQRARHAVEELARGNRLAYVRFHELSSVLHELLPQLGIDDRLRILLNPTRVWATFETSELVDDDVEPPVNVLFFGSRGEVATAVLELEGQALLNELVDYQPCTVGQWADLSPWAERDELVEFCRDLAEMGLVAIG